MARGPSGLVRALSLSLSVWSNSPQDRPGSTGRSSRQGLRRRPRRPRRGIPRRLSSSVGGGAPLRREERGERPGSRSPAAAAAEKGGAAAASPAPDEAAGVPQSRLEEGGPLLGRGEEPRCFCCRRRRGQRRVRGAGLLFWLFFPFCCFFLFFCFCCGSRCHCHCQGEAALQGDGGSCVGVGAGYFSRSRTVSVAVFLAPSKKEQKNTSLTSQFFPALLGDVERQGAGHPTLELGRACGHVDERCELRRRLRRDEVGKRRRGRCGRRRRRRFFERTGARRRRLWRGASCFAGSRRWAVVAFIFSLSMLLLLLWPRVGERRRGVFVVCNRRCHQ